jgi:hypothetical protein
MYKYALLVNIYAQWNFVDFVPIDILRQKNRPSAG